MCILTFQTVIITCRVLVVFLPSVKADLLPVGATRVMAEVVVTRLADDVAVLAVVRVAADQPVVVLQLGVVPVHPVRSRVQTLGPGDPMEQLRLIGTCNTRMRLTNVSSKQEIVVVERIYCFIVSWCPSGMGCSHAPLLPSRPGEKLLLPT